MPKPPTRTRVASSLLGGAVVLALGFVATVLTSQYVAISNLPQYAAATSRPETRTAGDIASNVGVDNVPDSMTTFIANFYIAYAEKDVSRLAASVEVPTNADDLATYISLLQNKGDGPHLFSSPEASETVTGYTILNVSGQTLTVREERLGADQKNTREATAFMVLNQAPSGDGTWLISQYSHPGSAGKYDGFLLQ